MLKLQVIIARIANDHILSLQTWSDSKENGPIRLHQNIPSRNPSGEVKWQLYKGRGVMVRWVENQARRW